MNKKQKILTAIALAVFAGIIICHYSRPDGRYGFYPSDALYRGWYYFTPFFLLETPYRELIPDVRFPIFALAVFYAGLFFILATPKGPKS